METLEREGLEKTQRGRLSHPSLKTFRATPRLPRRAGKRSFIIHGSRRCQHPSPVLNRYTAISLACLQVITHLPLLHLRPERPNQQPIGVESGGWRELGAGERPRDGQNQGVSHLPQYILRRTWHKAFSQETWSSDFTEESSTNELLLKLGPPK